MTSNQVFKIIIENIIIPKLQHENAELLENVEDLRRLIDRATIVICKLNRRYELTCTDCMTYEVYYITCKVCKKRLCEMCKFPDFYCIDCGTSTCIDCGGKPLCKCCRCTDCKNECIC